MLSKLRDFHLYCRNWLKIQTKTNGLQPFILREYQQRFVDFVKAIEGPKRVIVLKPRQAGFSTVAGALITHQAVTEPGFKAIVMADKLARTRALQSIYKTFIEGIPDQLRPLIAKNNTEEILFDDPKGSNIGLGSSITMETALDPQAGRSTSRLAAHLSETAFYRNYTAIDEGVHNSIPMDPRSIVIKESTANGQSGDGEHFYNLWNAATAGDSIYKPFFVAWYEVDDYIADPRLLENLSKIEKELLKQGISKENLAWRRLKLSEYSADSENSLLSPEDRFCQDFPTTPLEAFLSTGQPVYPTDVTHPLIDTLTRNMVMDLFPKIKMDSFVLNEYREGLRIYSLPVAQRQYYIGADVAEGLAQGDASSCYVMDDELRQVARWHGKIDPDLFGHLLAALGTFYNKALINPENNNMGHTTVTALRESGYPKIYRQEVKDKPESKQAPKYGWTTTAKSKMLMLNESITAMREGAAIRDVALARELATIARGESGSVELNGRDRTVAFCLAVMAWKHNFTPEKIRAPSKEVVDIKLLRKGKTREREFFE